MVVGGDTSEDDAETVKDWQAEVDRRYRALGELMARRKEKNADPRFFQALFKYLDPVDTMVSMEGRVRGTWDRKDAKRRKVTRAGGGDNLAMFLL